MRLRLIAAAILAAWPAWAQEEPIQSTITSQIEAFRAADFERAFTFASPTIHGIFGTPENFGAMVVTGYPMVVDPAQVEMQDLRTVGGALWQRVRVTSRRCFWYVKHALQVVTDAALRCCVWTHWVLISKPATRPCWLRLASGKMPPGNGIR